jgi:hypothetical protein
LCLSARLKSSVQTPAADTTTDSDISPPLD